MSYVFVGEAFACEDMAEMCAAICAHNFSAIAIGVRDAFYRAGDFVVERGPAAMSVEFVAAAIKGRSATFADVCARFFVIEVFAGEGGFGAFVNNYIFFFGSQFIGSHLFFSLLHSQCGHRNT